MTPAQQRETEIRIVNAAIKRGMPQDEIANAIHTYRDSIANQVRDERKGKSLKEILLDVVEAPGNALEAGTNKIVKPLAKWYIEPFTRTAGTLAAGAQALMGNAPSEEDIANTNPLFRPYGSTRETAGAALGMFGRLAPGTAEYKTLAGAATKAGVSQKVIQGTTGAAAGLVEGLNQGLAKSGRDNAGPLETVGNVAMSGTQLATAGGVAGVTTGAITDWWKKPATSAFIPKDKTIVEPTFPDNPPPDSSSSKDNPLTKETKSFISSIEMSRKPSELDVVREKVLSAIKPEARQATQNLFDEGIDPHVVDELVTMNSEDLDAIAKAMKIAGNIIKNPSKATKLSVNNPTAENMLRKVGALEELNKPLSEGIRDLTKGADNSTFDGKVLASYVADELPTSQIKLSDAERSFIEKLIDRLDEVTNYRDAHEYRQYIANATDQFTAPLRAAGANPTEADNIAQSIRAAVGQFLDDNIPGYAELRREEAPILEAINTFWKTLGGKWKGYDGAALVTRASQLSSRLSATTNPDMQRSLEIVDGVLKTHGIEIGGDIGKQNFYTRFIENLYGVGKPGGFKSQVNQAILNASDVAGSVRSPRAGALKVLAEVAMKAAGFSEQRLNENVRQKLIDSFSTLVNELIAK